MGADAEPETTIGRLHRQEEKIIEESGIPYTFLRPCAFMQNLGKWVCTDGKQMLDKVKKWMAIDPDMFPELLTELRVATVNEEMQLDKHVFTHDLIDSLRLAMCYYK